MGRPSCKPSGSQETTPPRRVRRQRRYRCSSRTGQGFHPETSCSRNEAPKRRPQQGKRRPRTPPSEGFRPEHSSLLHARDVGDSTTVPAIPTGQRLRRTPRVIVQQCRSSVVPLHHRPTCSSLRRPRASPATRPARLPPAARLAGRAPSTASAGRARRAFHRPHLSGRAPHRPARLASLSRAPRLAVPRAAGRTRRRPHSSADRTPRRTQGLLRRPHAPPAAVLAGPRAAPAALTEVVPSSTAGRRIQPRASRIRGRRGRIRPRTPPSSRAGRRPPPFRWRPRRPSVSRGRKGRKGWDAPRRRHPGVRPDFRRRPPAAARWGGGEEGAATAGGGGRRPSRPTRGTTRGLFFEPLVAP